MYFVTNHKDHSNTKMTETNLFSKSGGRPSQQHRQNFVVALQSSHNEWSVLCMRLRVWVTASIQQDTCYLWLLPETWQNCLT